MTTKPNILVIHADQHRAECIGAYGNSDIKTPNIDAIAKDGITYTQHFASFPICTPSRYSLLNGLYVHQHLGWGNVSGFPHVLATFPSVLKDHGYRTKAVGKMHFTPTYLDVGFEEMELAEQCGNGRYDDDYHRYLRDHGLADRVDMLDQCNEYRRKASQEYFDAFGATESDLPEEHYSTTWIANRATDAIADWEGDGNLLMVGFIKPHHPLDPPAPWSSMYDPDALEMLPGWLAEPLARDIELNAGFFPHANLHEDRLRTAMAMYYASISQIDHHVGRMIDLLQEKGLYENTMIIYTSDHGDYMGFHHLLLKGNYMYDPLIRIPLIIKYPAGQGAGTECDGLSGNIDVAPTILRQCGVEPAGTMTGIDLLKQPEGREYVFATGYGAGQQMVRTKDRKLLLCRDESKSLFFDLANDPNEIDNLFDSPDHRGEIQELKEVLLRWFAFEATTPGYLDYHDRVIDRPNVRTIDQRPDEGLQEYFAEKMAGVEAELFPAQSD